MINIKLRMSIEQIIFNLLNKNAHTWVRYWQQKEMSGLTMPGEYIETVRGVGYRIGEIDAK